MNAIFIEAFACNFLLYNSLLILSKYVIFDVFHSWYHYFFFFSGHEPKDFFQVWKDNCLIDQDLNLDVDLDQTTLSPLKTSTTIKQENQQNQQNLASQKNANTKKNASGSTVDQSTTRIGRLAVPESLAQRAPSVVRTFVQYDFYYTFFLFMHLPSIFTFDLLLWIFLHHLLSWC